MFDCDRVHRNLKHDDKPGKFAPLQTDSGYWHIRNLGHLQWKMGSQFSALFHGNYTMLPSKDTDIEVHEAPIDQPAEQGTKDVSAFLSLRSFLGRWLSRER